MTVTEDIIQLLDKIDKVWGNELKQNVILYPSFTGSPDLRGAGADWIANGILYDCKCYGESRPLKRLMVLQNLSYVLLDYFDEYKLKGIGWYFPRHQMRVFCSLQDFLMTVCGTDNLAALRENFVTTLRQPTKKGSIVPHIAKELPQKFDQFKLGAIVQVVPPRPKLPDPTPIEQPNPIVKPSAWDSIKVGPLSPTTTFDQLREFLEQVGPVEEFKPEIDNQTGESEIYVFVKMARPEDTFKVIKRLNG